MLSAVAAPELSTRVLEQTGKSDDEKQERQQGDGRFDHGCYLLSIVTTPSQSAGGVRWCFKI